VRRWIKRSFSTPLLFYFGGQLPLPFPDGLSVVDGPFGGVHPEDFAMLAPFIFL
jgi:hypothetical protein